MPIEQPRNAPVLAYLAERGPGQPVWARHDAVSGAEAYLRSGCHPDVVERLWAAIQPTLPTECRGLVHGTPALMHPGGLILAIGMGTGYGLRILPSDADEAAAAGARPVAPGIGSAAFDIRRRLGGDWVFGRWLAQEATWCQAVFAAAGTAEHLLLEPAVAMVFEDQDPAATEAERQRRLRAELEQRDAAGDPDAAFALFELLLNAAFQQRSPELLERAGTMLAKAAAGGQPKAVAMSTAWPRLHAEAQRQFPATGSA